jgi:tRNA pseudouridine synthase 10
MNAKVAGKGRRVLRETGICAWCLGRQYTSSPEAIESTGKRTAEKLGLRLSRNCELCGNAFENRIDIVDRVLRELHGFEFGTFQVGVTLSDDSIEKEDEMRSRLKLSSGISLKKGLTTMFRLELAKRLHKKPALRSPDMTIRIGLPEQTIQLESKPVTVYVEYLKLARGISTRAISCPDCRGEGCKACGGMGIEKGDESVEAELTRALLTAFMGRKVRVSWSGIEDESSLLVGSGRPTYVEVVAPAKRISGLMNLDMAPTRGVQLTRAEIEPLDREKIENLVKEVSVTADFESELMAADVELLQQAYKDRDLLFLGDRKGRRRKVYTLEAAVSGRKAEMRFVLDNGVSLRELLALKADSQRDQDRIQPSFADLLPGKRVLAIESCVLGFHKAATEEKH